MMSFSEVSLSLRDALLSCSAIKMSEVLIHASVLLKLENIEWKMPDAKNLIYDCFNEMSIIGNHTEIESRLMAV